MKVLLSRVSILGVAAVLTMSVAQAQRRGHGQTRGGHVNSSGQYGQQQPGKITHRVQKYMQHGDKINLARAIGQRLGYKEKVVALSITGQSTSRYSKVVLMSSGQKVGSVILGMYNRVKTIYMPAYSNISSMKLVMKGSGYIHKVVAATKRDTYQAPARVQTLRAQVYIQTSGHGQTLPLKSLVKQSTGVKLNNKKIKAVVVKAQALRARRGARRSGYAGAMAQVLVNGSPVGAPIYLNESMTKTVIPLGDINAQGNKIQLQVTGKALVKMVGLRVKTKRY